MKKWSWRALALALVGLLAFSCAGALGEEGIIAIGEEHRVPGEYTIQLLSVQLADSEQPGYSKLLIDIRVTNMGHSPMNFKDITAGVILINFEGTQHRIELFFDGYSHVENGEDVDPNYVIPDLVSIISHWSADIPNTVFEENAERSLYMSIGDYEHMLALVEEEPEVEVEPATEPEPPKPATVNVGDEYLIGVDGAGNSIGWVVVKVDETEGRALLLSQNVIDAQQFHDTMRSVRWADSSLRAWLNGAFIEATFDEATRAEILTTTISTLKNETSGISGCADTEDQLFILSIDECTELFEDDAARITSVTDYANTRGVIRYREYRDGGAWWLRSPGGSGGNAAFVTYKGIVNTQGKYMDDTTIGIRPAFYARLDAAIIAPQQ